MAEEEIKQLQNKRKKLINQQKQEERKKRDRRLYEKGGVFESIFTESKDFTKDEFYQLITLHLTRFLGCTIHGLNIYFANLSARISNATHSM